LIASQEIVQESNEKSLKNRDYFRAQPRIIKKDFSGFLTEGYKKE
jgi:hypothetical protein